MSRKAFSEPEEEFIRQCCRTASIKNMAIVLNTSVDQIKGFIYRNKLRPNPYRKFTDEEFQYIKDNYRTKSFKDIAIHLGRTADGIKHKVQTSGLKRSDDDREQLRQIYSIPSSYKKGHIPGNAMHDGAISIRKDKRGISYKFIRLSMAKWEYLQIYEWEKVNGPVPQGMVLRSINGDTLDCRPENWRLITKHENLLLNSGREELTDSYIAGIMAHRDKSMKKELLKIPELLNLKREELKLRRTIYEKQGKNSPENKGDERKAISISQL